MTSLKFRFGIVALIVAAIVGITALSAVGPSNRAVATHNVAAAETASSTLPVTVTAPVATTAPAQAPSTTLKPSKAKVVPVANTAAPTTSTTEPATDWPSPLQVAQAAVGTHPAYADKGFWCALAIDDWAEQAGTKGWVSEDGPSALANNALRDGRAHATPHPGDMVFINLDPDHSPGAQINHVGIVESVNGDELTIVDGNGDTSGLVAHHVYSLTGGKVIGFASFG